MNRQNLLLNKLYSGQSSKEELLELFDFLSHSNDDDHKELMQKLWSELNQYPNLEKKDIEDIYNKTLSKISSPEQIKPITKARSLRPLRRRWLKNISIAASFLIILGGFAWSWNSANDNIVISTGFAESKSFLLPDGSNVELNAGSQLTYSEKWCVTCIRKVELVGEAFFKVAKKESTGQKFQVVTSDLTVEVLGTAFNVNTLHDQTRVFLEEGKVKLDLKEEAEEMLMVPGDVVTYSIQTKTRKKQQFKKDESIVWRDGFISMKNIPLSDILQKVEDIYGEKFEVTNSDHLKRKFTIGMPVTNFETTLTVLGEVTKLNIVRTENHFVVN